MTPSVVPLLRLWVLLIVLYVPTLVHAQPRYPVKMLLEPMSIRGRSGGPIPIRIKLEYNQQQILEGDLLLEFYNTDFSASDLTATIRYEGIVLQGGDYFFDTVLPPIEHSFGKQYQYTAWFETKSQRIPLSTNPKNPNEPRELLSIGPYQRATLICSCTGANDNSRASNNRRFLNTALSLDNYNPLAFSNGKEGARDDSVSVLNYAANWDALDLPENPLHLCSFDIVLLADRALSRLESAQMKALQTWCEAGGSICVLPDDRNLNGQHLKFLRTLFERDSDPSLHVSLNDNGTLLTISDEATPVVHRRFGLGRATLLPNVHDLANHLDTVQLGQIASHLWKVHESCGVSQGRNWVKKTIIDALAERGVTVMHDEAGWKVKNKRPQPYPQHQFESLEDLAIWSQVNYSLPPSTGQLASACESALMPRDVHMVPTWVIGVLLIAYVITIGPVDYFLLGLFRVRKYTWLLFPVVTLLFTGATIVVAHRYMSSTETGGTLTIVDLVEDGRPVRQTDLQMHFYSAQMTLPQERSQAFSVPAQMIVGGSLQVGGSMTPRSISPNLDYSGRFPQAYTATAKLRQWEPQLIRTFTMNPGEIDLPQIDWNDVSAVTSDSGRQRLARQLISQKKSGEQIDAIILRGGKRFAVFPEEEFEAPDFSHLPEYQQRLAEHAALAAEDFSGDGFLFGEAGRKRVQRWLQLQSWMRNLPAAPHDALLGIGIVDASARRGTRDFFSIVSQVSPHGAASLEDLPLIDATDNEQAVLIVVVRSGIKTKVYRRAFYNVEQVR